MKKIHILVALSLLLLLCGCSSNQKYKTNIFSIVENNHAFLDTYLESGNGIVTNELSALGIQAIETAENDSIIVFEMYYTGLFDGGVEYGFYYTTGENSLTKHFSANDFMVIEQISDNWYYYEWHSG